MANGTLNIDIVNIVDKILDDNYMLAETFFGDDGKILASAQTQCTPYIREALLALKPEEMTPFAFYGEVIAKINVPSDWFDELRDVTDDSYFKHIKDLTGRSQLMELFYNSVMAHLLQRVRRRLESVA